MDQEFWNLLDQWASSCPLVIDRPAGSAHPRYPDWIYPLDYGYWVGTASMDGEGVDVWVGTKEPRRVEGLLVTVDRGKGDAEIKVLLGCTPEEQVLALEFLNRREGLKALQVPRLSVTG